MGQLISGDVCNGMKINMAAGNMVELVSNGAQSCVNYLAVFLEVCRFLFV